MVDFASRTLPLYPECTFPERHNPDHVNIPNANIPTKSPWSGPRDTPFGSGWTCDWKEVGN